MPNRTNAPRNGPTKTDLIKGYLTDCAREGRFPDIPEIQGWLRQTHNLSAAKSTVSEARTRWQQEYDAFRSP